MSSAPATPLLATTGGLLLGGSTTFLLNLGRAFQDLGKPLPIVCLSEQHDMAADFAALPSPVQLVDRRAAIYEDRTRQAYLYAASQRPAAVLACLGSDSFEVLRLAPPHVVRLGVIQSDDPDPYEMSRHYAPWLDAIIGVSPTIVQRLEQDSAYARVRKVCIPYGIHFAPGGTRPPRNPAEPLRLVYVGRIIETQKRISRLVELARLLSARQVNFEFTLAGSGPELASIREALKDFPRVRLPGDVPNAEVSKLLRSHDVFVLLSDYEGLPLSLLEAMGEGAVPVVSDLESGIRDVVTPATGCRVPIGDVAAAADAIELLARDPQRLAALSAAAGRLARGEYSAARMAERYLKLIAELDKGPGEWPADPVVPAPLLVRHPWLYRGLARRSRRLLKAMAARRV